MIPTPSDHVDGEADDNDDTPRRLPAQTNLTPKEPSSSPAPVPADSPEPEPEPPSSQVPPAQFVNEEKDSHVELSSDTQRSRRLSSSLSLSTLDQSGSFDIDRSKPLPPAFPQLSQNPSQAQPRLLSQPEPFPSALPLPKTPGPVNHAGASKVLAKKGKKGKATMFMPRTTRSTTLQKKEMDAKTAAGQADRKSIVGAGRLSGVLKATVANAPFIFCLCVCLTSHLQVPAHGLRHSEKGLCQ